MISLFIGYICLQILDVISTYLDIVSGKGKEANKILLYLMSTIGILPTLIITKIVTVCIGVFFYVYNMVWPLGLLVAFYSFVVVNNFRILLKE